MTRTTAFGFVMLLALAVTFAVSTVSDHMAAIDARWAQDAARFYDRAVEH